MTELIDIRKAAIGLGFEERDAGYYTRSMGDLTFLSIVVWGYLEITLSATLWVSNQKVKAKVNIDKRALFNKEELLINISKLIEGCYSQLSETHTTYIIKNF